MSNENYPESYLEYACEVRPAKPLILLRSLDLCSFQPSLFFSACCLRFKLSSLSGVVIVGQSFGSGVYIVIPLL